MQGKHENSFTNINCTKIIATLGPSSSKHKIILSMAKHGVTTFRINASHGTHKEFKEKYELVRFVEKEIGRPLAIILDLQGPKQRVGSFDKRVNEGKVDLVKGQKFRFMSKKVDGNREAVHLPHKEFFEAANIGDEILLNDGLIAMKVLKVTAEEIFCDVMSSGELSSSKGITLIGSDLDISFLTKKDLEDLKFGIKLGVDYVALSFVSSKEDLIRARELISSSMGLIAKIEKSSAVKNFDSLIEHADAFLVARGDLGVELEPSIVPAIQKELIASCRKKGKPVIVATQMLESMTTNARPTRAEASDVANALYDGADAVMLSAETASGLYPLESVIQMEEIIKATEEHDLYWQMNNYKQTKSRLGRRDNFEFSNNDAIAKAAVEVAIEVGCVAVATFTTSGSTTIRASRLRLDIPILGLTPKLNLARRLSLVWGVYPVKTRDAHSFDEMGGKATRIAKRENIAVDGDSIVVTAGIPFGVAGTTNILRIVTVGDFDKK